MSITHFSKWLPAILIASTWHRPAAAQYQQAADGHLLDASNQAGSGGYNFRGYQQPINATNLIVTGNVTGGRSFQGFSPIRDSNQFFLSLPSSGLDTFRRDSVAINESIGGVNMLTMPRPYYSPSQTILNAGAISAGLNTPGTSTARDAYSLPYLNPLEARPYTSALGAESALSAPGTYQIGREPVSNADGSFSPTALQLPAATSNPSLNPWLAQTTLFSSNFALRQRQESAAERAGLQSEAEPEEFESGLQDLRVDPTADQWIDRRISADAVEYAREPDGLATDAGGRLQEYAEYALPGTAAMVLTPSDRTEARFAIPSLGAAGAQSEQRPGGTEGAPRTRPGGPSYDAFEEARRAGEGYRQQYLDRRRSDLLTATPEPNAGVGPGATSPIPPDAAESSGSQNAIPLDRSLPGEFALPLAEVGRTGRRERAEQIAELYGGPIATFVGQANNAMNQRLAAAEELMRSGQYFRAAGQYKIAEVIDPAHPLPVFGRAHALIAAGEYNTAVRLLVRGIDMFPGFANFRIDLNRFIPDAELLDRRRADIEKRLADMENPEFRFLLGYIEFYMGLTEFGMQNLLRAAAQAPEGSTIARFPPVLRERLLAEQRADEANEPPPAESE